MNIEAAPAYPATFDVAYPDRDLDRVTTLFRIFMLVPIAGVVALLTGSGEDSATWPRWIPALSGGGLVFGAAPAGVDPSSRAPGCRGRVNISRGSRCAPQTVSKHIDDAAVICHRIGTATVN